MLPFWKKAERYYHSPLYNKFDKEQHLAYVEFFHKLKLDAMELHKRLEKFSRNPAYIQMYRSGNAYHQHILFICGLGRKWEKTSKSVIVVGADNEYIPKILGYETARTMQEAIRKAKETAPEDPSITCFRICPLMLADVELTEEERAELEQQ